MKTLGIIGCGWLGTRLGTYLSSRYKIYATSRSEESSKRLLESGFEVFRADFSEPTAFCAEFNELDALFISTVFPRENTEQWLNALKTFIGDYSKPVYLCSSTGIYPEEEAVYTETGVNPDQLNPAIYKIESSLKAKYSQLNILRLGGLMGDERYLSKFFVNRPLPKAGARINYIHFEDIVRVTELLLNTEAEGVIYNVVAPEHPRKNEVYKAQTGEFVSGKEFNRIISSEKLIKETGYTFVYPDPVYFPYTKVN